MVSSIYGSKMIIIVEGGVDFGVGVREAGVSGDGRHEGVNWWVVSVSEPSSEAFPYQSQGSLGDEFFEVHSPKHLLIVNFHNWPWCKGGI